MTARKSFAPKPFVRNPFRASVRAYLLLGLSVTLVLIGGVGGWAAMTPIVGAVIAGGTLTVDSSVKKVQHPTGGVVGSLNVRDGDHVVAGAVLLKLDDTQLRANLAIVEGALDELEARGAREEAERDNAADVTFPDSLLSHARARPATGHIIEGERRLFHARAESRAGQEAQLREQINQLDEEIRGFGGQAATKVQEIGFVHSELVGVQELRLQNLVSVSRLNGLQRDEVRIGGELQALHTQAAQAKGKKSETALRIIQIGQDLRTEVDKDLAEIRGKMIELGEKKTAAADSLQHVEIRAPQTGTVHQSAVHTIGGVITPGEPIMLIVPDADDLIAEVKVQPKDIDQLYAQQSTLLRFAALDARTTPNVLGAVKTISPDITQDARTGASYYTVRIGVPRAELDKLGTHRLVPGMPVEAFIRTGERTVLSYLVKPMADQIETAWRER